MIEQKERYPKLRFRREELPQAETFRNLLRSSRDGAVIIVIKNGVIVKSEFTTNSAQTA